MKTKKHCLVLFFSFFLTGYAFSYDPLDCVNEIAKVDKGINVGLAARLCAASWSPAPVECYRDVSLVDKDINRGTAVDLCAGSINAEKTIACYSEAGQRFNRGIATTLCGAKKQDKSP